MDHLSLPCIIHIFALGNEKERFRAIYAGLQSQLNPDEITGKLYSKGLLTMCEKDEINNSTCASTKRMAKLLDIVERAIHANGANYETFLDILDSIPQYKPIVEKERNI